MSDTLTQLIAKVQAQLIDNGTRFTTATCTAAIRAALSRINKRIPLHAADQIDAIADQLEYAASTALYVTDVLLFDADGDEHSPLEFQPYEEDNRQYFRLKSSLATDEIILCRYAQAHTVSGLDSSTDSTLTADQDNVIVDGACVEALKIRAASRIETINLQQGVSDNYREVMVSFANAFEAGLRYYERRTPAPSPNRQTAWNDEYYGWNL